MRILITGSRGLIGSALKQVLMGLGVDVVEMDICVSKEDPAYGDILDQEAVFERVEGIDGIVHLAAKSRVIDGENEPELCWKTNVEGTENIVKAAFYSKHKPWILYASSREVYGQPLHFPVTESAPLVPLNMYGKSKCAGEELIQNGKRLGLATAIVRFSNVFGSVHDHPDRVIPAFCLAAAQGKDIKVNGISNLFDFTYLEDVVQGTVALIGLLVEKGKGVPPINLASGKEISLGEVAKIAQRASLYPIRIVEGSPRAFDVSRFWGDTTRAEELLNWRAHVGIEGGMNWLINQYRLSPEMQ